MIEEAFDEQYEEYYIIYEEEEDLEQSKEEGYEEPSCSTSDRCSRNGIDDFYFPYYDEFLGKKSTSDYSQMLNGRNPKESF